VLRASCGYAQITHTLLLTMGEPESMNEKKDLEIPANHAVVQTGEVINASGHVQELERNFSLLSVCSVGICTGNTWAALGGE
jgi:hypothetical protein